MFRFSGNLGRQTSQQVTRLKLFDEFEQTDTVHVRIRRQRTRLDGRE